MKKIPRTFLLGLVKNSQVTIFFDSVAVSFCCSPVLKKTNFLRFFSQGATAPHPPPPTPPKSVTASRPTFSVVFVIFEVGGWSKNGTGGLNFLVELGGLNIFRGGGGRRKNWGPFFLFLFSSSQN